MNEKLARLSKESIRELEDIGLGEMIPKNLNFTINYKAKQRFGQCVGKKDINISSWLLEVGLDHDIKNTIIHEILHTFTDTIGHKARWQYYARYVNNRTDYNITTKGNINQVYQRANAEYLQIKHPHNRYEITCLGCGAVYYKSRLQERTLHGYKNGHRIHYACGCNRFKVVDTKEDKILVNGIKAIL